MPRPTSSRSRCAPASAGSPCARGCCCAATRDGGSSPRSWSTTTWSPRPGSPRPSRPPRSAGRSRCATPSRSTSRSPPWTPSARTPPSLRGGCRTAKVKVAEPGQTLADDEARLEAVRDALGPAGLVRVDANGGWTVDEAVTAIGALDRAAGGLEYVEQPCPDVEDLAAAPAPRRRADRRRRVDPAGRGPLPGPRPRGRRRGGAQGAAARRGAGVPADRGGHRAARAWSSSALETSDRDRRRRRPGRRAPRAGPRVRARDGAAAHRRRGAPTPCSRWTARCG